MPSPFDSLAVQSQAIFLPTQGVSFQVLSGQDIGGKFVGTLEIENEIDVDAMLGNDPRKKIRAKFLKPYPRLKPGDMLQEIDGPKWRVLENPEDAGADVTADFYLDKQ